MKAIICTEYGSPAVLHLRHNPKPMPKDDEILIKVIATTAATADVRIRGLDVPVLLKLPFRLAMGWSKPRNDILGTELAGVVEAVGQAVQSFRVGDSVFGSTGMRLGAYAEYVCLPESAVLTTKPSNLSYEEAAAVFFGGHTALHFLNQADIQRGQNVLIYGASGSIGTYAVQLAKVMGAKVTGVCSAANLEMVKALGADHVIDYTTQDFTQNGVAYDVIFDTVGKSPFAGCVQSLTPDGYYLRAVHMTPAPILRGMWVSMTTSKKVVGGVASETQEDLEFLKELLTTKAIKVVIDRCYPLAQLADAHRYVETGHKKGNVVIMVGAEN